MVIIDIRANAGYLINRPILRKRINDYLSGLGLDDVELSLALVGKRKMRQLNQVYRNLDKISDVLAFPQNEARTPEGGLILGDIVVCYPCAQKEAIVYQEEIDETVWDFVEHGLSRLVGENHKGNSKFKIKNF
ncbi:MAG: rRNA maturation RNase YbeY [Candidatus Shapirobacteria bacterium]|nr:rRNA maturation RNase YbeY [Candidatus Shapirobacteria bacterium]MDD5073805.1 rRNA maturation RNase YbeY [Candidatus Shapirobacteria bacterium]MDD5481510.1 rRNA maturation RNase YbeY [Candidatus Shapirobacteria bacterium]